MIKLALPIIFIFLSIGLFFVYINPSYKDIQTTLADEERLNQALDKSKELQEIRDKLLSKYNTFSTSDLNRLSKLLPDHIDNVRLILDIDHIASTYGMRVKNITVSDSNDRQEGVIGPDTRPYRSVILSFSVTSSYNNLKLFIRDLEKSLRIVDIINISLSSQKTVVVDAEDKEFYDFDISLKTYWLKK